MANEAMGAMLKEPEEEDLIVKAVKNSKPTERKENRRPQSAIGLRSSSSGFLKSQIIDENKITWGFSSKSTTVDDEEDEERRTGYSELTTNTDKVFVGNPLQAAKHKRTMLFSSS